MASDFTHVIWDAPNLAYYGLDPDGNIFTGPNQEAEDFELLPILYSIKDSEGNDILYNITLFGYMPADKKPLLPDNASQINCLTRYSRIGDGSVFKEYAYKDLGTILDTIYTMAENAQNSSKAVEFFMSSDKMTHTEDSDPTPKFKLKQGEITTFHDLELTTFDSSIGESITVATDTQIGDILNGSVIDKNSNLFSLIKKMLTKRTIPFTYKKPSVAFSGSGNSSVEFGTTVNVNIGYSYTQNDGPRKDLVTTSGVNQGSFKPLPSASSRSFTFTVNWPVGTVGNGGTLREDSFGCYNGIQGVTYLTNAEGKGYAPDNNKHGNHDILGNELSSCAAGNASKTVTVSGYYYCFYGASTSEYTDLSSTAIRALNKVQKPNTFKLSCNAGTKALIFASPTKLKDITQQSAMNASCIGSFTKDGVNPWETEVMLADGVTSVKYYVYKYYTDGTLDTDTFNITL